MKKRLIFSLLVGFVVGSLAGFTEGAILLPQIPWWIWDISTLTFSLFLYGIIGALLTCLWTLVLGRKLGTTAFQKRIVWFTGLALFYLMGGFYLNHAFFPKLLTAPSLAFTAAWTVFWAGSTMVLSRSKFREDGSDFRPFGFVRWVAVLLLEGLLALGLLFFPPRKASGGSPDKPNLLLIVADTVRADHVSAYGYERPTTPHIDRIAREGVLFEKASTTAPWTLPSHATLFTGLHPTQHGADWSHTQLDGRFTTLAEFLRARGYQTAAFSNNPWVSRATNFNQGFDFFWESWSGGRLLHRLSLVQIADRIEEILFRNRDDDADITNADIHRWFSQVYDPGRPFFIFINYLEAHFPYVPPGPYRTRFLKPENRERARAFDYKSLKLSTPPVVLDEPARSLLGDLYDGEIAYVDMRVGEIRKALERRGLLDSTAFVLTSDHGESIGEHQIFEHQFCVYETLLHVPLIFRFPGRVPAGVRIEEAVSLADVVPTALTLLDLEATGLASYFTGANLFEKGSFPQRGDRPIISEYTPPANRMDQYRKKGREVGETYFKRYLKSLRIGNLKYIEASDGGRELYDLGRDAGESQNLTEENLELSAHLSRTLQDHLEGMKTFGKAEAVGELDKTTLEELKALGYLH